jgi:ribonuclease R
MSPPLTRDAVLDWLDKHPGEMGRRDLARAFNAKGPDRAVLRQILKELEEEGAIARSGRKSYAAAENPPPTGVVHFERVDSMGDLLGRMTGRDGLWGPDIRLAVRKAGKHGGALGTGDRALCRIENADGNWVARPIKKLNHVDPRLLGVFVATAHGGRVTPVSRKDKIELIVPTDQANGASDGDLVRCEVARGRGYGPKQGLVLEVLGRSDAPRAASLIAMHAHNVPDGFTEDEEKAALAATPIAVPREDLRQTPLITIDPEDARDHDDAVFAEPDTDPKNKDGWRVIVAIADVAAYVRHGELLDDGAYRRGNSTYFPDRVSPMLPEALSADQCSLREHEDRLCFALEMRFDAQGNKIAHRFARAIMRSAAKLSYHQAQAAIDGKPDETSAPLLETVLKPLWAAYFTVRDARQRRAPLDLDLPERRVVIGEDGLVKSVTLRERFDAHKLIEEFMIQANVCAAETLEAGRVPLLYRVHDAPSDEKLLALANYLDTMGLNWTRGQGATPERFNKLLALAAETENSQVISEMVLRSQSQANYNNANNGHFGLNLLRYAHFTSPIRRYSDLIVHRGLIRALKLGPDGLTDREMARMEEIGEHLTMTERRSMAAERDASDRYLAAYLADKIGAVFEGRVAGVTRFGLFVKLTETGADGFIPVSSLGHEYYHHDEKSAALVGERSRQRFEMGMAVEVKLLEATPVTGGLLFEMLTDPRPARKGDKGAPEGHRGRRGAARPPHLSGNHPGGRKGPKGPKGAKGKAKGKRR